MEPKDLPKAREGQAVVLSGKTWNKLLETLAQAWPKPGKNVRIEQEQDGRVIHAEGGAVAISHPFQTQWVSPTEDDPPVRRVGIRGANVVWSGTTMDILVDGVAMDFGDWTANVLEVGLEGVAGYVCLLGNIDDTDDFEGVVDSWELVWAAGSVPANTSTEIYRGVAYISGDGVISQIIFQDLEGLRMGPPGSSYSLWSL